MTKDESDLIIAEQNKSTEEILKAVAKVKSDYHELCKLKDMRIAELEAENERIKTKYYELQDTLKNVRLALIKERTANIMNYGKGGVEMFDSMFEILKDVSN